MPRGLQIVLLFCLAAFSGLVSFGADARGEAPDVSPATGNKLDLSFVPVDAVAISVIQPHRLFTGPQGPVLSFLMQSAGGKQKIGFDPSDIDQAMLVVGLPDFAAMPCQRQRFGIVVHFVKSIDQVALATKIVPLGSEASVEGRKARINARPTGLSCAFVDATTLLISHERGLHWLLTTKPGDSPLRKLAADADDSPDWQLLLAVAPLRPVIEADFTEAAKQSPQLSSLPKIPNLADTVTASLRQMPHGAMQFDMSAVAPSDASAKELAADVKQLLDAGRNLFLAQLNSAASNVPPQIINQMRTVCDNVVAALQPTQAGNGVNFHADIQSGPAAIGMGVALLLPAVQAAREAAQRNEDANNLKQLALCLLNYEDQNRHLPAQAIYDKQGKPLLSWRVMMLPYLEEDALYKQFHLDEPWDSEHNKPLIDKMPDAYMNPKFNEPGKTVYQAVVGKGCAFEETEGTRLASFTDGTSQTILVVEAVPGKAVPWTKPEDWIPDDKNPMQDLGGLFAGDIVNVVFADGHVEALSTKTTNPATFKAMLTRNGGEKLPP